MKNQQSVTISKEEYEKLKTKASLSEVDPDLLKQLMEGFKDIKEGRFRRVR